MRIGELAESTGTTTRQLRYYEEHGLLSPNRSDSNYRDYNESDINKVRQIRLLVESGMPTRLVRLLLPCVEGPDAQLSPRNNPELAKLLTTEDTRLRQNIDRLQRSREQVLCYLDRVTSNERHHECVRHVQHGSATSETYLVRSNL